MTRDQIRKARRWTTQGYRLLWIARTLGVRRSEVEQVTGRSKRRPRSKRDFGPLWDAYVSECNRAYATGKTAEDRERLLKIVEANFPYRGWPREDMK